MDFQNFNSILTLAIVSPTTPYVNNNEAWKLTVLTHQQQLMLLTTWQKLNPNALLNVRDLLPTIGYDDSKRRLLIQPEKFHKSFRKEQVKRITIRFVSRIAFLKRDSSKAIRDPLRNLRVECLREIRFPFKSEFMCRTCVSSRRSNKTLVSRIWNVNEFVMWWRQILRAAREKKF